MKYVNYKSIGKVNYEKAKGEMIVVALLLGVVNSFSFPVSVGDDLQKTSTFATIFIFCVLFALSLGVKYFLCVPVVHGGTTCLLENYEKEKINVDSVFKTFGADYYHNVIKVFFMRNLWISIYTLLFIVPGIIKSYEYFCVPYLVALNPNINEAEARKTSTKIMYGHKMELFLLQVSFVGWVLLGVCTCGVLNLIYVNPWIKTSETAFFVDIYNRYVANLSVTTHGGYGECSDVILLKGCRSCITSVSEGNIATENSPEK